MLESRLNVLDVLGLDSSFSRELASVDVLVCRELEELTTGESMSGFAEVSAVSDASIGLCSIESLEFEFELRALAEVWSDKLVDCS